MPRAISVTRRAAVKAERIVDAITLDHRGRDGFAHDAGAAVLHADGGLEIALALAAGVTLNEGDALKLEDGGLILIRAAEERLLEIRAENPARLLRAALLAGGAHALAQADADAFYILPDDSLAEAIRGLGCSVTPVARAFSPDRLAVNDCCGHDHGHDHAHGDHHTHTDSCGHDHKHDHQHEHTHAQADDHAHEHGAGCGCGHGHDQHAHKHQEHVGHGHEHAHQHSHEHKHDHAHDHDHKHKHGHAHDHK